MNTLYSHYYKACERCERRDDIRWCYFQSTTSESQVSYVF